MFGTQGNGLGGRGGVGMKPPSYMTVLSMWLAGQHFCACYIQLAAVAWPRPQRLRRLSVNGDAEVCGVCMHVHLRTLCLNRCAMMSAHLP